MSVLNPNSFQDSLTSNSGFGKPLETNGPSIADQYGAPYVSRPVNFVITSNTGISATTIAAERIASTAASSASWGERIHAWGLSMGQTLATISSPIDLASSVVSRPFKRVSSAITSTLWKLLFIVAIVFVGYLFLKTISTREAEKVAG